MDHIKNLLREKNLLSHKNQEILIVPTTQENGLEFVKNFLYTSVNQNTLLLLSGGRTPKELYEQLAKDEVLKAGAVGQIDERYGKPLHDSSNQKMLQEAGLLRYFQMRDIPFYPMLTSHPELISGSIGGEEIPNQVRNDRLRRDTALQYDVSLRDLFSRHHTIVGILGIGLDGHTAGIPADKNAWEEFDIANRSKTEFVIDYDDHGKFYKERITMTFLGLSMLDVLVVLVFGDDKKEALMKMFDGGKEEEIPSIFYTRTEIAKKTVIVTDQKI